jgi:hypothetical protein
LLLLLKVVLNQELLQFPQLPTAFVCLELLLLLLLLLLLVLLLDSTCRSRAVCITASTKRQRIRQE